MNNVLSKIASHILIIDGEEFPVYHQERRLYRFINWQDARNKLIKIILTRIKDRINEPTAFINFRMANPMRKTRLGNFFIDISADIMLNGTPLKLPEDLDFSKIFVDRYVPLDEEEIRNRIVVEEEHSSKQYEQELDNRVNSLIEMSSECQKGKGLIYIDDNLRNVAEDMMIKDGWSKTLDNRIHARHKRKSLETTS